MLRITIDGPMVKTKYIDAFPKPLLADLTAGRWLPIIGAGFSKNAFLPPAKEMPVWSEISKQLCSELDNYSSTTPIDAISAYEHEFGRSRLIERLIELLFINEAQPGDTHKAFCSIPFNFVCTTNFDTLLEQQYRLIPRSCIPLIYENQLTINQRASEVELFKLHGDLHDSDRLIVSESDYDGFLSNYPLIATYLANLLINKTAVFIGYSLDDPDFRQIWHVIGQRLGRSRRKAYVLSVSPKNADISRYDRRGVKVINLLGERDQFSEILAQTFNELREYWEKSVLEASQVREEPSLRELALPDTALSRLCFFAVPLSLQPFYREQVFPIARDYGFIPITEDEIISPGDSTNAKIDALIKRSPIIVVDASSQWTVDILKTLIKLKKPSEPSNYLIIRREGSSSNKIQSPPFELWSSDTIPRPEKISEVTDHFFEGVKKWFADAKARLELDLIEEPQRLLKANENRAAVISAISLLECELRQRLEIQGGFANRSLRNLIKEAFNRGLLEEQYISKINTWVSIRNESVHTRNHVEKRIAKQVVEGSLKIVHSLREPLSP
jgi:hypothetical protein